jgi:ectoine hydroxylase-related dioxygenase (phytanoyl-CoA dioxygenase family)
MAPAHTSRDDDVAMVRDLTDEEVAHYHREGWVKAEALIPADVAAQMLATVERVLAGPVQSDADTAAPDTERWGQQVVDSGYWRDYHYIAREDKLEPFHSIAFSQEIGRNSKRLLGREVGVRYNADFVAVKVPGPADSAANRPTDAHQDFVNVPFDRVGNHNYWIALDHVTPAQGSLRFYSRSHRLGPLGLTGPDHEQVLESYREILDRDCELSPPLELRPGDATIHSSLTIHLAPSNATERNRIAYILAYMPADSRYTGAPYHNVDGTGLRMGDRFEHPRFPVVYE